MARRYRNAALARRHPDYVGKAKNVLCGKGALPATVEGLVEGFRSGDNAAFSEAVSGLRLGDRKTDRQFMNAVWDLLHALQLEETQGELADGGATDERPSEQAAEIREGLEALYLKDLGERFPKIVDRAARLDPLSFPDSRLHEAAQCYLYGCFAAAVVFAAAAVEARLRWKTGLTGDNERTPKLLDEAKARALLDDGQIAAARTVFARRNRLLHRPSEIEQDVQSVRETLALARGIITALEQA